MFNWQSVVEVLWAHRKLEILQISVRGYKYVMTANSTRRSAARQLFILIFTNIPVTEESLPLLMAGGSSS